MAPPGVHAMPCSFRRVALGEFDCTDIVTLGPHSIERIPALNAFTVAPSWLKLLRSWPDVTIRLTGYTFGGILHGMDGTDWR